jgi:ribonuclease HI
VAETFMPLSLLLKRICFSSLLNDGPLIDVVAMNCSMDLLTDAKLRQSGYAAAMIDYAHLLSAATKSELSASRELVRRTGCSPEQALRQTLEASAAAGTLAQLLAERALRREASAARILVRDAERAAAVARRRLRHDGPPTAWRAWFDGSAHPNPGACGIGALLTGPAGERIEIARAAGYGNSSEAEYRALIALLEAAVQAGAHGLTIYGDSKVVIDDFNGSDSAAAPSLGELRQAALALTAQLRGFTLRWIPRHKNSEADALSQRARSAPTRATSNNDH